MISSWPQALILVALTADCLTVVRSAAGSEDRGKQVSWTPIASGQYKAATPHTAVLKAINLGYIFERVQAQFLVKNWAVLGQ